MRQNLQLASAALALMLACFGARAQTPGGVTPAVWYKADGASSVFSDAGTTAAANNATVQQWNDAQGTGYNLLQATASARPVFSNSSALANFNPTVTFDGSNDYLQFNAGTGINVIDRANGSIFTAGYVNTMKQSGFAGFHASMDYPGLHVFGSNNKLLFFTGGPGYQGLSADAMKASSFFSAGAAWQNGAGTSASYAAATVSLSGTRSDYAASQLNNANLSTGARDFRIGADNNYGAFSGQLNEVIVFEDKLTTDQMDRVETYLAIKYGTTYAAGARDYKTAAGSVVWSASINTGLGNNIAGIGRDDAGALHQKQSWSTNTGRQVLIGTGTLAGSNAGNSVGLSNGQFLIWGDNGLAKAPNIAITGVSGVSHRFASIWKVQNTGSVGVVRVAWPKTFLNLKLIQSADATIDGSDTSTDMAANETTINGITYNYADVTFTNGQYFTFAAKVPAPGGVVNGILMWHKADDGVTTAGAKSIWQDMSGNGRDVTQTNNASYQPTLVTNPSYTANSKNYSFNFNPFYYFDGTNDFFYRLNDAYFPTTTSPGSTYGVMFNSNAGGYNTAYGWGDDDPNLVRANDNYQFWRDNGLPLQGDVSLNTQNAHIGGMAWKGSANGLYLNVDGRTFSTASYNIGNINNGNPISFQIGSEGYNLGAYGWEQYQGGISEVFAYSVDHQNTGGDEKQRINSYLAIKYGITLKNDAGTAVPNYLSSSSAVIWNATANAAYSKNIAGLAKDDASALNQKQSKSNVNGQQVLIGTTGLGSTNTSNSVSLSDGQFVLWGDNGLTKSLSVSHNTVVGGNQINLRFGAVWKVQNTGSAGTVRVTWPTGIVNLHLIQSTDDVISTTDTHTLMSNTISVNGASYNYADVTLSDGSYFTFGGYIAGPGGVGQDLSLWYRGDSGVETDGSNKVTGWNNSTATQVKLEMSSTNAYIPYNDQTTKSWNFNPTLSFDGTNNYLRNSTTDYLTAAGSVHYIAVTRLAASASGFNSIFAIAGNDDGFFLYPQNNLIYPMPAIGNGYNAVASGPGSANRYGIFSAILPKTGTPVNQRGFYNGLEKIYTSPYPLTGGSYSLPTKGAYIGADGTTGDNPNGDIAEVIVYHQPAGGDMTNANLAKIHSYLAIKYGITLDQSTPQNYINSSAGIVRDATANAGYQSNIAGIARDDQGGLYQKQSTSVNPGAQVVIGTTGLSSTNASNTAGLSNGQFLIWGDNGLAKAPTVSLGTISGLPYNRFAAIWKVQNTSSIGTVRVAWVKGYANLKLVQSTDATIDLSDVITEMSSTLTIGSKEYAYADVTLADGSFFTLAAVVQGPGGVTANLTQWYRADYYLDSDGDGQDASAWSDFNGGSVSSQLGVSNVPKLKIGASDYFNFNPGVNFTGTDQQLGSITERTLSSQTFDIFTATKEGMSSGRFFSIGVNNTTLNGTNWDHPGLYGSGAIGRRTAAGTTVVNGGLPGNDNFASNGPSVTYNTFTNTSVAKGLNGAATGTPYTHAAIGDVTGGHIFGSNGGTAAQGDDGGIVGNVGELIVYGAGSVSASDRNKVDSYLAIKYGVTLAAGANYTTSAGTVVWNATANAAYQNNVAGIGNDFKSALHQKQSRSQITNNSNNQVTIALGSIAATNDANTNALTDGQFLLWGDNGTTTAMTNSSSTFTTISYGGGTNNGRRMNRIWKVQNTGVSADVQIRFLKASIGTTTLPTADACGDYVILFASDAAFTSNLTAKTLTLSEDGLIYDVTSSFPSGASYFTYAKVTPVTTGTVYLPATTEETTDYTDNCATGAWTYFRNSADASKKLFATTSIANSVLSNLTVRITTEGVTYEDGTKTTKLMPRITTVTDASSATFSGGKVRVYYSQSELSDTQLSGALVNGWFKYEGDAEEVMANVYSSGSLDGTKTTQLTPSATGVEDGVNYVEFSNISSFSSFIYLSTTSATPLPVTLTYFNASKEESVASLKWATTEEVNNKGFEIQRSLDAKEWFAIGFVADQTGTGNSKGLLTYSFTDAAPLTGVNYYRLKQIDNDETFRYSSIAAVKFENGKGSLYVYPNPVSTGSLSMNLPHQGNYKLSVYNISGLKVLGLNGAESTLDIRSLSTGVYVLRIVYENGETHSKTFIVK